MKIGLVLGVKSQRWT